MCWARGFVARLWVALRFCLRPSPTSVYAQMLVAVCATTGATLCFLISNLIGKEIMQRAMPKMLATFREKVRFRVILSLSLTLSLSSS